MKVHWIFGQHGSAHWYDTAGHELAIMWQRSSTSPIWRVNLWPIPHDGSGSFPWMSGTLKEVTAAMEKRFANGLVEAKQK